MKVVITLSRKRNPHYLTTMNPALEYIHNAPEPYRDILLHLQAVIERTYPELQLKFKWRLPFYYLNDKTMFCFLNFRKTFVEVGMPYGTSLKDTHGALVAGENRKMLRSMRYETLASIDDQVVIETLAQLKTLRTASK